ncbi:MAG: tRNA (adenosine(37)-N6)-dimethylallyltransferase MiaA [Chloroflexi bacterium]|nr:tRNA (adenosine(37)-N6)-dimethylallyltransferase MiaA [Chloroflexota bacterium]MQC18445.1 tRNA (adenosine(37)-N6)-dimethylallyltransferase MiaA [Chloroflexota bacterium]MQC48568.1 tRNA (adenosine(37)-N6)-dimethylallyltransferase MiaA [Chloroflexota bacterium]
MSRPRVVAIVGPTASGKTGVALEVARRIAVEVVSADSRQVRAGMRIGTAMPTPEELAAVRHHLIGVIAPDEPWNLQRWLSEARAAIAEIHERGATPLVVGGTGQYVWALLEGWDVPAVEPSGELRADLEARAAQGEGPSLYARLASLDSDSAARIDPRNVRRVIRALEIIESTGAPVAPLARRDPGFVWSVVGIRWTRPQIHARADARARTMFEGGLIDEVRTLVASYGRDFDALRSIGYREALAVLDGDVSVEEAIRRTQIETHRLIRMQANWFRPDDSRIQWIDGAHLDDAVAEVVTASVPR